MTRAPLHSRIRKARLKAGLSQTFTAAAVGCSREHYARAEGGGPLSPRLAYRLAAYFSIRVAVADLFPDDDFTKNTHAK